MEALPSFIGIYGGTFDPVHTAHLRLAIEATEYLSLSQVIWVPSGNPCHRNAPVASTQDRLSMLKLALASHKTFRCDTVDLFSAEPTYTVNTLQRLKKQHPAQRLILLLGMDSFLTLPSWYQWQTLFELAHIAVATRLDYAAHTAEALLQFEIDQRTISADCLSEYDCGKIIFMPMMETDVSASVIRLKAQNRLNLTYLVHPNVENYIIDQALYQ